MVCCRALTEVRTIVGSFPELAWSASPQDTAEEEEEPVDHTIVMSAIVDTEGEGMYMYAVLL